MSGSLGPLDGILVADFSRVLAGPYATMMLGDLGADVVKVEQPGSGDETRRWGPPFVGEDSAYYLSVNRNKRSVVLDLADDADRVVARRLVDRADIVVENFRPGSMRRFGLDYPTVQVDNPGLIYCSISGFGSGPGAAIPGYDFLVQALSGLMSITGAADGEPVKVGVAVVDVLTGLNVAVGVLAALRDREQTGRGQLVEVDLLSSALAALVNQASTFLHTGTAPTALGNQHPSIAPYETLATATRPLVVAVGTDRQFAALCEAISGPELADDRRFADNAARVQHRQALIAELELRLSEKPAEEWITRLNDVGAPCGLVNDIAEGFALADRLQLSPVVSVSRPDGPPAKSVSNPIRLSATPVTYRLAPPRLGQDSQAVRDDAAD